MSTAALRFDPSGKLPLHSQFADYLAGKRIYPVNVEISPCGVCNASCDFCWYASGALGGHRKVFLDTGRLLRLLGECAELGVKSISWTGGGEPSLHPEIAMVVEETSLRGLEQGMFTNALSMPKYEPALLSWVRVTITDRPMRPDYIRALRACPTVGIAFNYAGPEDDDLLRRTLEVAEDVEADYVQLRPALLPNGATVNITPPAITHPLLFVTGYKFAEAQKPHGYRDCEGYHFAPFVWEDGNVDVCAYHRPRQGYTLGNLYRQTLREILDAAPDSVPVIDSCQVCCKLHETNLAIHRARSLEDRNFP